MGEVRKVLIVREEWKTKIPYVIDVMAEEWRRRGLEADEIAVHPVEHELVGKHPNHRPDRS